MKNKITLYFLLIINFIIIFSFASHAQEKKKQRYVQFSGVVVESDSLKGLPFTSIVIRSSKHGTISDYYGFFTLVAKPGDVIEFVSVGYRDAVYKIPDTLQATNYSIIQVLRRDTVLLKEIAVYPWPTKEQFKDAFLNLRVPNSDLDRAQQNLAAEEMRELVKGLATDSYGNYRQTMQQQYTRLYYIGQYPPNNLLNPVAWAQFIKSWREGKLKIK